MVVPCKLTDNVIQSRLLPQLWKPYLRLRSSPDRLIRLMECVHTRIPHGGTSNPPVSNTDGILAYHDQTGEGVNCRLLATVLNEVWLDDDQRWIMLDPSFNAYVTDDQGRIVGLLEFRRGLRLASSSSRPRIHINRNADWNGKRHRERDYFAYMTKNLYRFHATADSRSEPSTHAREREPNNVSHHLGRRCVLGGFGEPRIGGSTILAAVISS